MQQDTKARSKKMVLLLVSLLMAASLALTACGPSNTSVPLIYGVWDDFSSPLNYVVRADQNGQNKTVMAQGENGIFLFQFATRHNYSVPISQDGNYLSVYLQDGENQWTLNLVPTTITSTHPVYTRVIGENLARYIEGFSPTSRFYAYTIQDPLTGSFSIEVVDLNEGTLLPVIPNSFFVDYFFGTDTILSIAVTESGSIGSIQQINLPDETATDVFIPPAGQEIGLVMISPDGQNLIYYELIEHKIYSVPVAGGTPTEIYAFNGENNSVNYDPDGNYLVMLDVVNTGIYHMLVMDNNHNTVFETNTLGSQTLVFSTDGHYLAWQERVNDNLVLNLTDLQAGTTTLISDAGAYFRPYLLPESNQILYIQYAGTNDKAGELMIANLDGTDATRLDMAVTSYQMTEEGQVLYWKVNIEDYTSILIRVGLDGANPVQLMGPEPGVCKFIN